MFSALLCLLRRREAAAARGPASSTVTTPARAHHCHELSRVTRPRDITQQSIKMFNSRVTAAAARTKNRKACMENGICCEQLQGIARSRRVLRPADVSALSRGSAPRPGRGGAECRGPRTPDPGPRVTRTPALGRCKIGPRRKHKMYQNVIHANGRISLGSVTLSVFSPYLHCASLGADTVNGQKARNPHFAPNLRHRDSLK